VSGPITVSDVLDIKYLGKWDWSPDGRYIAFIWDDGGLRDLWLVEPGKSDPKRLTRAKSGCSDFAWTKDGKIYAIVDGSLVRLGGPGFEAIETLLEGKSTGGLSLSPDGSYLAFAKGGAIWLRDERTGRFTEFPLPSGSGSGRGPGGRAEWSPSSHRFAFTFRDEESYHQIGVARVSASGVKLEWRSHFSSSAGGPTWLDENTLMFTQHVDGGLAAELRTVKFVAPVGDGDGGGDGDRDDDGAHDGDKPTRDRVLTPELLYRIEGTGRGPVMFTGGSVSPDRTKLLLMMENDGWAHYYILDLATKEARQVTFGQCEDFAHAGDSAKWLPDGSGFLYASNRDGLDQRHIYRYSLETGESVKIIDLPGTNSLVNISPDGRLAFQHCDAFRNGDLWVSGPNGEDPAQVTFSMPEAWNPQNQFEPEEVRFESAGGLAIHAYLMKPKGMEPGKKFPAIVWVHGGPIRQMRRGWHPQRSYALFHAYNQYLVQQGYVVLSVNFRGGIGYGRDFRQALYHKMGVDDVADVVGAGNYLKGLPYVDSERVAVYGLSYGGYMTLHCLTQYPDVFKCGINIAGIWDYVQWTKWADKRYGKRVGSFKMYLGGEPEASPALYRQGSPKTYAKNMKAPLLNVHGTADMNVDFQQMDSIIRDLVELGKDFEVVYYPGEVHTFAKKKTWMDAMPKMTRFFDKHLRV
jgi:dipeptidyl aminopeptidase/acylaminoacyl peptidase